MTTENKWIGTIRELGPKFAEREAKIDATGDFVSENYQELKANKVFSAGVPTELGGGGASHGEVCELIKEIAHYSGSTSLAYSMHAHPMAMQVFRFKKEMPGAEAVLRKLAGNELVITGTGANDWLGSSGTADKVEGGYKLNAHKHFCSGAPGAQVFISSIRHEGGDSGPEVLHFSCSMNTEGLTIGSNWNTLGMRGTGSHDIFLKDVFIPDASIAARRPADKWHMLWNIVLPTALPLFMSSYVGIAERAAKLAREVGKKKKSNDLALALGEMENSLAAAQDAWRAMIAINGNHSFAPNPETVDKMFIRKVNVANATKATVEKAAEVFGGAGFFKENPMEQLVRDIRAAHFHPLPERRQQVMTGRLAMGLDPLTGDAV